MAKKIDKHHQPQKQGMKRDFETEGAHRKQQHNSEMVAYLSLKRMLQSLLRRGQQQLRDGCSSPLTASSPSVFLGGCFFFCFFFHMREFHVCPPAGKKSVHASFKRGRPTRARFLVCTNLHETYQKKQIQNKRTHTPHFDTTQHNTTQHNSFTQTT